MIEKRRLQLTQAIVAVLWFAAFAFAVKWFIASGVHPRHWPRLIVGIVRSYGMWGPLVILALYALRSVFFLVPTSLLTLVSGTVYGPVLGTVLNLIGENLSASIAFGLGRLFGRRFVREHENGWLKTYDELLRKEGFLPIVFMRMLYFPFDLVNYGSGMSGVVYRQYAIGTFVGLLPSIVVFTILGDSFTNPRTFVIFIVLFVLTLAAALLLRRSDWVKRKLYPVHVHDHI